MSKDCQMAALFFYRNTGKEGRHMEREVDHMIARG